MCPSARLPWLLVGWLLCADPVEAQAAPGGSTLQRSEELGDTEQSVGTTSAGTPRAPVEAVEPDDVAREAATKRRREFACRRHRQLVRKLRREEEAFLRRRGWEKDAARARAEDIHPFPECDEGSGYPAYLILPGVYYTTEVGLAFLIHNELQFLPEGLESDSWPSSVTFGAAYTTLNQFLVESKPTIYLDENRTLLAATYLFRRYTDQYYGIGNSTSESYQAFLEYVVHLRNEASRRVLSRLYLGVIDDLKVMIDMQGKTVYGEDGEPDEEAPPLLTEDTPGFESGLAHGLGAQIFWDGRDNIYAPSRGGYYHSSLLVRPGLLGSDYENLEWQLDVRQFLPLFGGKHVVALQLLHEMHFGDVPFHMMAHFGGAWQMRGYRRGRYRDYHQTVVQAEYRFPLIGRFSGAAFLSTGQVYGEEAFAFDRLRVAGGVGARFKMNDTFFVRMDVALGDQAMVIFNGGHAF